MLRERLARLKDSTTDLNFGRDIIREWVAEYAGEMTYHSIRILDIGCDRGTDLLNIREALTDKRLELYGVEIEPGAANEARRRGIQAFSANIEAEPIPVGEEFFDIVVANQIIEHTREIFWIFGEISRILKPGGILIVGVPNLASLHNRVLLLLGEQPSTIEVLGPHVRGFTAPSFKRFVEADGYFKLLKLRGSNFYPFPAIISRRLSQTFPTLSVALFFMIRRQEKVGSFISVLDTRYFQTAYFKGNRTGS